ncbi:DUF6283 family protein [Paracoccus litorisediminis]|uniref:DUF6283 family protein n=1 Tax=Paracoccus litorisediminis TaxID=2006130 RepID=UPI00373175EB
MATDNQTIEARQASPSISPPKVPCGSCPYRKDVPPGIWAAEEYEKLPLYDGETWEQSPALFMCHQRDGCLCGGWLMAHDRDQLLALRISRNLSPEVWTYNPEVEVWESGAAAAEHGKAGIDNPSREAQRKIDGLIRSRLNDTSGY